MKYIKLTQNKKALVDDEDFEWLSVFTWHYKKQKGGGYAARNSIYIKGESRVTLRMHREIMKTPGGLETDHEDGNKLNNQRSNLRIATKPQNQWNRKKQAGASVYKGVYWQRDVGKWKAQLQFYGKKYYLGLFDNEIDAAKVRDAKAMELHGEFAVLNFPKEKK